MGKNIHSFFVEGELSFLKLVSVLIGLSGGVSNFSSDFISQRDKIWEWPGDEATEMHGIVFMYP